jgi:SAM-dependent methyltransferase
MNPELAQDIESKVRQCYVSAPFPDRLRHVADFEKELQRGTDYYRLILRHMGYQAMPATILVAGCGTGEELLALARLYPQARISGLDLSPASVEVARENITRAACGNASVALGSILDDLPGKERYDLVFCSGVIHHLADPERGFKNLAACIAPAGAFVVSLYHRFGYMRIMLRVHLLDLIAGKDLEKRAAWALRLRFHDGQYRAGLYDSYAHPQVKTFSIVQLRAMARRAALTLSATCPPASLKGALAFAKEGSAFVKEGAPAGAEPIPPQKPGLLSAWFWDLVFFVLRKGECFFLLHQEGR